MLGSYNSFFEDMSVDKARRWQEDGKMAPAEEIHLELEDDTDASFQGGVQCALHRCYSERNSYREVVQNSWADGEIETKRAGEEKRSRRRRGRGGRAVRPGWRVVRLRDGVRTRRAPARHGAPGTPRAAPFEPRETQPFPIRRQAEDEVD